MRLPATCCCSMQTPAASRLCQISATDSTVLQLAVAAAAAARHGSPDSIPDQHLQAAAILIDAYGLPKNPGRRREGFIS